MLKSSSSSKRPVFFISDRTGVTAEALGSSLITQFDGVDFDVHTLPFVDSAEKARTATKVIQEAFTNFGTKPIVFSTLVDDTTRSIVREAPCYLVDFFETFIGPLEKELGVASSHTAGRAHDAKSNAYNIRIAAVNFSLNHDDGLSPQSFEEAELIILGVSRSGKTPTSLYLAMQYGIKVANYPLTEDDLDKGVMPKFLLPLKNKLVGLTIDPIKLQTIRTARRPNSRYADLRVCQNEVATVERLFEQHGIPYLPSTDRSIEELATKLLLLAGIERKPL